MVVTSLDSILISLDGDLKTLEALSKAAEAAERYDDMVKIIEALVTKKLEDESPLTSDQRNLLSVAYKNVVGVKRSSVRILGDNDNQFDDANLVSKYRDQIEDELKKTCLNVLDVLIKLKEQNKDRMKEDANEEVTECQIFYLKMIGDYYRYLTEAFNTNEEYKTNCSKFYEEAMALATENLEATHPTRLGLALNYSVCFFEILEEPKKACDLAKKAFDEAIEKLDSLSDASYRDSTLIMQLLRDNLTIWTQAETENEVREE